MTDLPLSRSGRSPLQVACAAATTAGGILMTHFHHPHEVKYKGKGNLLTEIDILSEKAIVELLSQEFPEYGLVTEESSTPVITPCTTYTWLIDPLDGTNNYVFGIPFFCVNIALIKGEDILWGITYDPLREELFQASKGEGASLNNLPISVAQKVSLQSCLVGCDLGYSNERGREVIDLMGKLWSRVHSLRIMGSAALGLAYVTCGRLDLYFHRFAYPWDVASGILMVTEAGGAVSTWEGKPAKYQDQQIIAANRALSHDFAKLAFF